MSALARFDEAQSLLKEVISAARNGTNNSNSGEAYGMLGILQQRRGDEQSAIQSWKESAKSQGRRDSGTGFFDWLVVKSLARDVSVTDVEEQVRRFVKMPGADRLAGSSTSMGASLIPKEFAASIGRDAFRSPRGQEYARKILFRELPFTEHVAAPICVLIYEGERQGAFSGNLSFEQDELAWQTARAAYQAFVVDGKLGKSQALQLALAWKGFSNFLGWNGLAPSLPPDLRGKLAYIMAHRYLRLEKPDDAKMFFQAAARDAPKDSLPRRLAQQDLDLLTTGQGRLRLTNDAGGHVQLLAKGRESRR